MARPLLTVIIPVYNTGGIVDRLISSIFAQVKNAQIILINDGSTDNSLGLIKSLASTDRRISVISQKNSGPAAARNAGLERATGKYISFLDSDDEIDAKFYTKILAGFTAPSCDLVTCGMKYHRLSDNSTVDIFTNPVTKRHPNEALIPYVIRLIGNDGRLYSLVNKIFRLDLINQHHIRFDPAINFGEDLLFVLAYLKHANQIAFINQPLYTYHYGTATSIVKQSALLYANWQHNWRYLTSWHHPTTPYETDQLNWVKYRWVYSYCFAVCRSKETSNSKRALLKMAASDQTLPKIGLAKHIGHKKYYLELLFRTAQKAPALLSAYIRILYFIRLKHATSGDL